MSSFQQITIGGYSGGGLTTDKKPFLLNNEAFSNLRNAYTWRDRVKKRQGLVGMGQLQRSITVSGSTRTSGWMNLLGLAGSSPNSIFITNVTNATQAVVTYQVIGTTLYSVGEVVLIHAIVGMSGINGQFYTIVSVTAPSGGSATMTITANTTSSGTYMSGGVVALASSGSIVPGSINLTAGTNLYKETIPPTGILVGTPAGTGFVNYATGLANFNQTTSSLAGTFSYYPGLPVTGICKRDVSTIGIDSTVFFDTEFAYQFVTGAFQELVPGTVWTGTPTDMFWTCNFQGADPSVRLFFATNNNITLGATTPYDPIRYYNSASSSWTPLQPLVTASITLWQALIVIPYYGRLIALNTWEGSTGSGVAGATNFFSRCRFSQIGDPTSANAWRTDIFGLGGFLDAPTNEAITGAAFYRNTLIVFFEYSTWELRYVGQYGLPFIFERISSDFGSISTYSSIIFDQGVMTVSDRGIIEAGASGIKRLDEQIPETVFSFEIQDSAPNFVHGIRDFEKELVYWNYVDESTVEQTQTFPNTTLLFNYRNNTWAKFRDTITAFGLGQFQLGITWDSLTTSWDSEVSWDNVDDQQFVDFVTAGNQQGFIFIYENPDATPNVLQNTMFAPSLVISAVQINTSPTQFTSINHNLANGEFVYISGALWHGVDPGINNQIYKVTVFNPTPATPNLNTFTLSIWDQETESYIALTVPSNTGTYAGNGVMALLPRMDIVGKDFNPFQGQGKQFKLSFIDFQMDTNQSVPSIPAVSVKLFVNSCLGEQANLIIGNQELSNGTQFSGFITNVATGAMPPNFSNPCLVTSPGHSLKTGQLIYMANVIGASPLDVNAYYNITVVDANHFTLDGINATGFPPYVSGGIWNASNVEGQTYVDGGQYAWYRFYSTQYGQYLRVGITYDDTLMNQLATHQTPLELNAMNLWLKEGGRLIN